MCDSNKILQFKIHLNCLNEYCTKIHKSINNNNSCDSYSEVAKFLTEIDEELWNLFNKKSYNHNDADTFKKLHNKMNICLKKLQEELDKIEKEMNKILPFQTNKEIENLLYLLYPISIRKFIDDKNDTKSYIPYVCPSTNSIFVHNSRVTGPQEIIVCIDTTHNTTNTFKRYPVQNCHNVSIIILLEAVAAHLINMATFYDLSGVQFSIIHNGEICEEIFSKKLKSSYDLVDILDHLDLVPCAGNINHNIFRLFDFLKKYGTVPTELVWATNGDKLNGKLDIVYKNTNMNMFFIDINSNPQKYDGESKIFHKKNIEQIELIEFSINKSIPYKILDTMIGSAKQQTKKAYVMINNDYEDVQKVSTEYLHRLPYLKCIFYVEEMQEISCVIYKVYTNNGERELPYNVNSVLMCGEMCVIKNDDKRYFYKGDCEFEVQEMPGTIQKILGYSSSLIGYHVPNIIRVKNIDPRISKNTYEILCKEKICDGLVIITTGMKFKFCTSDEGGYKIRKVTRYGFK